jgi:hypothetical protein
MFVSCAARSARKRDLSMKPPLQLLIVSSRIEAKKALLHIVEGLPVNAFTSPTIERGWEVLMNHPIDVIFCDG